MAIKEGMPSPSVPDPSRELHMLPWCMVRIGCASNDGRLYNSGSYIHVDEHVERLFDFYVLGETEPSHLHRTSTSAWLDGSASTPDSKCRKILCSMHLYRSRFKFRLRSRTVL